MKIVFTDEERKEFIKGFPDPKRNNIVSDRTMEEFLVKWVGYPLSQATSEPFENLSGEEACEYLVIFYS